MDNNLGNEENTLTSVRFRNATTSHPLITSTGIGNMIDEYVINPNTGRKVRIGSATYKILIRQGIYGNEKDNVPYVLCKIDPTISYRTQLNEITKSLPSNITGKKGIGKYRGYIVSKMKCMDRSKVIKEATKVAAKVIIHNKNKLESSTNYDFDLENLILKEMNINYSDDDDDNPNEYNLVELSSEHSSSEGYENENITWNLSEEDEIEFDQTKQNLLYGDLPTSNDSDIVYY